MNKVVYTLFKSFINGTQYAYTMQNEIHGIIF